jgi:uncharacterized membrane protein YesL
MTPKQLDTWHSRFRRATEVFACVCVVSAFLNVDAMIASGFVALSCLVTTLALGSIER